MFFLSSLPLLFWILSVYFLNKVASQMAEWSRIHLPVQEMQVRSLGREDPGEANANPLQDSRFKNPMDRGTWWAAVWTEVKWVSCVRLFVTPRTIQFTEFSRPEYCSGWPFPSPGDLPNPGIEPRSPAVQADSLPAEPQGKPKNTGVGSLCLLQGFCLLCCRWILYPLSYQSYSPWGHKESDKIQSPLESLCTPFYFPFTSNVLSRKIL